MDIIIDNLIIKNMMIVLYTIIRRYFKSIYFNGGDIITVFFSNERCNVFAHDPCVRILLGRILAHHITDSARIIMDHASAI